MESDTEHRFLDTLPYPVLEKILRELRLKDLLKLLRVSRGTRISVREFLMNDFNADAVLSPFILDIDSFQAVQARTQAVIGGSIPLSFFIGVTWRSSDLDVYVPSRNALEMGSYLLANGYNFIPGAAGDTLEESLRDVESSDEEASDDEEEDEEYYPGPFQVVLNFEASFDAAIRIQLIATTGSTFECFMNYHSTVVLNMLTSSRAISLYPYETMKGRGLRLRTTTPATTAHSKYAARGFQMHDGVREVELHGFARGYRYVGDDLCAVVQLSGSSHDDGDILTNNSWTLRSVPGPTWGRGPTARLKWFTRRLPGSIVYRTVPSEEFWSWLRRVCVEGDDDLERRACAYLCRIFDRRRLKCVRHQLQDAVDRLQGTPIRPHPLKDILKTLPGTCSPDHAAALEESIVEVRMGNAELEAKMRQVRDALASRQQ
ncbi:uncharacterized protein SCHCODRAFT_02705851 [Schizophyllum commune H4-8]|nr:uncharacterized protein SCHCODRAFT_01205527 [Schizophyllum commune H4-8]XP_003027653.1 uncharacterized protein SCHCODRAFT_02705834 [Schizophyllum commune H4-8]XP_003027915.1 uncharacterized protein SCHCODRAFT_02520339 [Schizophyllum commune H4-8]XP_050197459.1 uncharacterized protein SCHCODRAFT_02673110 [Schizophyllum commune H4-8]XP_050197773.1 uncharacterized protein SCHCODRAFT_02672860 [Schizophyllum commune H4-8]XP_050198058.1 uncharacterized protein SCHCODRAFT_02705851 [Schizophyllum c